MRPLNLIVRERLKRLGAALVVWLAGAVLTGPRCAAQVKGTLEFSPIVGTYIPIAHLPPQNFPCLPEVSCQSSRHQSTAIAVGARMTAWVNQRIAVEGSLWYSPSAVTGEFSSSFNGAPLEQSTNDVPAQIVAANARILVSLTRRAGTWAYLVGGPALVDRFGDAYAGADGTARAGGVVGAGAHVRVARSLAIRAELEQYLYSYRGSFQRDLVLSVGLSAASRIGSAATP